MIRLGRSSRRRLNALHFNADKSEDRDIDSLIAGDLPMDIDDQEFLIKKFEVRNYRSNQAIINVLNILYLIAAGFFLFMSFRAPSRQTASILVADFYSILSTCVTLRYEIRNDYQIFRNIKLTLGNSTVNILNGIVLTLVLWISLTRFEGEYLLQFLFQIPLFIYLITILLKKWAKEMELELSELRELKYKYKSV